MNNMMIDIETISVNENAVVVSIGARIFDPKTGELGESFYRKLNFQDQFDRGRVADESTLTWWLKQSEEARAVFQEEGSSTKEVLEDFFEFCSSVNGLKPWGNGPSFDLIILETLYRSFDYKKLPWDFWNIRCLRTFKEYIYDGKDLVRDGVFHHALDDADHQIKIVHTGLAKGELDEAV